MKKKNIPLVVILTAFIFAALAGGCDIFNPVIDEWWVGETPITLAAPLDAYRITFDSNGGDYIDLINTPIRDPVTQKANPWPQDIISGMKASEPGLVNGPSATPYIVGWYTAKTGGTKWNFSENTPTGNMTLYAHWSNVGKEITFDYNAPTGSGLTWTNCNYTPLSENVVKDGQLSEPKQFGLKTTDPLAKKYYFDGWYTTDDPQPGDKAWDFSTGKATDTIDAIDDGLNQKIKLYAKWTDKTSREAVPVYNVTFDSGGANGGSRAVPPAQQIPRGQKVTQPNALTKTDYVFEGWYADGSNTPYNFSTGVTKDLKLTARWKLQPYSNTWFEENGYHVVIKFVDDSSKPFYPFQYDTGESDISKVQDEDEDVANTDNQIDVVGYLRDHPTAVALIKGYGDPNDNTDTLIKKREQDMRDYLYYTESGIESDQLIKYADFNNGAGPVGADDVEAKVYIYVK